VSVDPVDPFVVAVVVAVVVAAEQVLEVESDDLNCATIRPCLRVDLQPRLDRLWRHWRREEGRNRRISFPTLMT
jgi:hypothetical protein